jgi:Ca2+-binding EF-hand superfamily protein
LKTVESLGGWEADVADEKPPRPPRQYSGVNGKQTVTDDELRKVIKSKFSTIVSAFRAFDKNGDGCIDKKEFITGLRNSGVDLPPEQMERLWSLADEDNSGNIHYQEFARRFCTFKASHSLHRHADLRQGEEGTLKLHGVGAAARIQRSANRRGTENIEWGVDDQAFNAEVDTTIKRPQTIPQLARQEWLSKMPVEEMSVDQMRARIYSKHGNLLNAFRHFDLSGDSRVSHGEFLRALPLALGEEISSQKANEVWRAMDKDGTGDIDIEEFASDQLVSATEFGAKMFKGLTVDCAAGERPAYERHAERMTRGGSLPSAKLDEGRTSGAEVVCQPEFGSSLKPADVVCQPEPSKGGFKPASMERPESASTVASVRPSRPQSAGARSVVSVADSYDEYSDSGFEASSTAA